MEEVMYWCPCQLAMKNNAVYWSGDEIRLSCNITDYHLTILSSDPNYAIDTAIHNVCRKYCEYYKSLLEMSEGVRIN